jgi:ABC-type antimicrobial peptide transport system permease subunit
MFALAVIGTYGVAAYGISERTHELGIRAALGATAPDIRRLLISEGLRLAFIGVVIGAVLAALLSRTLSRFLFQTSPLDPVAFVVAPTLLILAVSGATFIPAQRAAGVEPMRVLRTEE